VAMQDAVVLDAENSKAARSEIAKSFHSIVSG
jgi:hypothetical protein